MPQTLSRRAVFAGLAALATSARAAPSGDVVIFAAASLQNALDEAARAWEDASHQHVRLSYAASSVIARQIVEGAPADIFISADAAWMDDLQRRGLVLADTRRDLISNHLALIAPAGSATRLKIGPAMPLAAALGEGRLAIAGPDVPAGRYAEASLRALGVWPAVEAHLARGESVRATLAFVARGEAPLGVVYDTDAKIEPRVRIVGLFPDRTHPPIVYPAALVKGARPQAPAFLRWLAGPQAAAIFRRYGFRRP
jgi:molybdate transport system substrate-binding protein